MIPPDTSRRHQLAVGLQDQGGRVSAAEVGGHHAPHAEGGIQAAIGQIARQGKVGAIGLAPPAATSLPSGCRTRAKAVIRAPKSWSPCPRAEGRIQAAIWQVARQGKVAEHWHGTSRCHQLAVGLQDQGTASSSLPKSVVTLPPTPKVGSRLPSGR